MTTSWGGTSLPDPTAISLVDELVGSQYITADGALNTDSIATRTRYSLTWSGITAAEMATIQSKATTNSSASLVMPVYGTVTVIPVRNSFRSDTVGGASAAVNCSCEVRSTS